MPDQDVAQKSRFHAAAALLQALPAEEHCWCSKAAETQVVAGGFVCAATCTSARQLWQRVAQELCACPSCIIAHHQAQVSRPDTVCSVRLKSRLRRPTGVLNEY